MLALDPDMPMRAAAGGEAAVAFALFQHIAERDPGSVARKDDAISVFRECMAAVGRGGDASHEPRPIRLGESDQPTRWIGVRRFLSFASIPMRSFR